MSEGQGKSVLIEKLCMDADEKLEESVWRG